MAQLTWEAMNPIDTSKYLDAIQKAQAQSVAGVDQIGAAYKGYHDNLKKQNTNDMLTALNQAQNPEELAAAQSNIAAMQQRWGTGYDMDAVRTAMDERPAELMQRQSTEMDFKDKQANRAARPEASAIRMAQLKSLGATDDQLARIEAMDASGADSTAIADSLGQYLTNDRNFTNENFWKLKNFNQGADQFEKTFKQNAYQYNRTATREEQESALRIGETLYKADQGSGAGIVQVAADGTEYTTGGGGAASIANYASKFGPLAGGMIHAESRGNPNAVSPVGAQGIVQIMPKTAAKPGYGMSPIDLKNSTPEEQIRWGMEYRSRIQKAHGFSEDQATAAYNAGAGRVQQAIKQAKDSGGNWLSYLPKETRDYVPRVNKATAQYANGGSGVAGNTPTTTPLVGIDRKVQQKIRGEYQNAMLKYNENLALKDQPVNVGNVLAGLTAKEKGSTWTQDSFNIVNALKDNEQLKGLSAEGITNVYNRAKSWQAKPGTPIIGYNSADGLKASINNYIRDEIGIDAKRKEHVAKASHPSNTYAQQIQQEFEAKGVSISAKEALLHIDPARYQSLYGKPTVKVQEAVEKKVDKVAATAKASPSTATAAVATAAKPKPAVNAESKKAAETSKQAANLRPYDKLVLKFSDQKTKTEFDKEYEQIKKSEQKAIQARKTADAAKKAQKLREDAVEKRKVADILVKRAREEAARKAEEELRMAKHRQALQARRYPAPSDEWLKSAKLKERLKQNR